MNRAGEHELVTERCGTRQRINYVLLIDGAWEQCGSVLGRLTICHCFVVRVNEKERKKSKRKQATKQEKSRKKMKVSKKTAK
jgi:hypothetical protein